MLGLTVHAHAKNCAGDSGNKRVAIVELYTSEGCSGCPSAGKWLSQLPSKSLGRQQVIPLALYVDYWNQIGWYDKFSQEKFTAQQKQHSARRHPSFVYMPQIFLNGDVYLPGFIFDAIDKKVKLINAKSPLASIKLQLDMPETSI